MSKEVRRAGLGLVIAGAILSAALSASAQEAVPPAPRVALTAHATVGFGNWTKLKYQPDSGSGFGAFVPIGWGDDSGPVAPGVGLRLLYLRDPYLLVGANVEITSFDNGGILRGADLGLVFGVRLPSRPAGGRVGIEPYVMVPFGASSYRGGFGPRARFSPVGFHVGALFGANSSVTSNLALYAEAGVVYRRVEDDRELLGGSLLWTNTQIVVHIGLRLSR